MNNLHWQFLNCAINKRYNFKIETDIKFLSCYVFILNRTQPQKLKTKFFSSIQFRRSLSIFPNNRKEIKFVMLQNVCCNFQFSYFPVNFKAGLLLEIYIKVSKTCTKPPPYTRLTLSCTMLKNSQTYF